MIPINLKNEEFLDRLENIRHRFIYSFDESNDSPAISISSPEDQYMGGVYCSPHYLQELRQHEDEHQGFPEKYHSYPISSLCKNDPEWEILRDDVKVEFTKELGAHTSALFNYYPVGGYVGWHTNWNAHAYQILFTWSETGAGYFRYLEKPTNKIVTLPDKPGWQARLFLFGKKDDPDNHCWHCAYTECERITLAFKYTNEDTESCKRLIKDVIEELEYDE